ncbi:MAG: nucleotidyl transferase AbiEii/AbiGii toxin family protein [Vulcanimicrobiaceae bacterium]
MSDYFRVATEAERSHYESTIYPLQDRILAVAAEYGDALVLTGGTALARLYLRHRYSDDLDFFTLEPRAGALGRDFANALAATGFDVVKETEGPSFLRMMVGDEKGRIQVDVAPDEPRVDAPVRSPLGVFAHTLREIGANKICAFEDRSAAKDAVDLFHLQQHLRFPDMFADADRKRIPIAYEDLRHFLATPLSGYALLTPDKPISSEAFVEFVALLRFEVEREIKKKTLESRANLAAIIFDLLWDTPCERRVLDGLTRPVLKQRLPQLVLPKRMALAEALGVNCP